MTDFMDLPDNFTWDPDTWTLTFDLPCPIGIKSGKVIWDHNPTPEQWNFAITNAGAFEESVREVGQGNRIDRLRWGFYLYRAWGPPTWWVPRPLISLRKREIGIGWLQSAYVLYYQKKRSATEQEAPCR